MNDVTVTVTGFVGTTPKLSVSANGVPYTSFRVAHTKRRLDRLSGRWVDAYTTWFTVKLWNGHARNAAVSFHKGDPVVVTGSLAVDEWSGPDGLHTNLVIEAKALGHDLTRGEARFTHTVHRRDEAAAAGGAAVSGAAGEVPGGRIAGMPDVAAAAYGAAAPSARPQVDGREADDVDIDDAEDPGGFDDPYGLSDDDLAELEEPALAGA